MSLDQLAAGALVRARPWDVVGAALGAPMIVWGFLGWFGTVGDSGGGIPGFYSGTGAAGIALVLAAAALTLHQLLEGRAHTSTSPPVAAFLAGAAAIIVLGGMIAKPDSATIGAGSVAGLLTALTQIGVLVMGWLRGSDKTVRAAHVRAVQAQQAAADQAAVAALQVAQRYPVPGFSPAGYGQPSNVSPQYGQPGSGQPQYGQPQYGQPQYGQPGTGQPQYGQPYPGGFTPAGGHPPQQGYPPQPNPPQNPGPPPTWQPGANYPPPQGPPGQPPR